MQETTVTDLPGRPPRRADSRRNRARILSAAGEVVARRGSDGSTEEIARLAGVAVGTVFRHFPTKDDLLRALMKQSLEDLRAHGRELARDRPATALAELVTEIVTQAAARSSVVELLARGGTAVPVDASVGSLADVLSELLDLARRHGTVRPHVTPEALTALVAGLAQGAAGAGWSAGVQRDVLAVVLAGLAAS